METPAFNREEISDEVRTFFIFVLGRGPQGSENRGEYIIFEAEVSKVNSRIYEYIEENPGTKARVIYMGDGDQVTAPWLNALDPEGHTFMVVNIKEDYPAVA